MARQAERRQTTRSAILAAARRGFGEAGFEETSVEDIAGEAGVAKGAVYHYFATKESIFEAVLEAVSAEIAVEVRDASRHAPDVLAMLIVASEAYFAATARPAIHRIVLMEGPAILGWESWREIDARHFTGAVPLALEAAMTEGLVARQPTAPLSRVLQGAMTEAAMAAAGATEAEARAYIDALTSLINGLRTRPATA